MASWVRWSCLMTELDLAAYVQADATALAEMVRSGAATAEDLRALAGAQHAATHAHINAIVEWYDEPTPSSSSDGLLAGVPFLRKDYGSAEAGRLVEMGSRLAAGHRAAETAEYIRRIQTAGAQILGRTAVPEFIQHGSTESAAHGLTRNPTDLSVSSGGSSGGAAAAVAAGVVPVAHASDCAGSIRIPASTCGLIGLKPGRHRVPWPRATAEDPGAWGGIASEFVVTRSVRDARLFLDILGDGSYAEVPERQLMIAYSTDHWAGAETDDEIVAATEAVVAQLRDAGHFVEDVGTPFDYDQLMSTWHPLFTWWTGAMVAELEAAGHEVQPDSLEPLTQLAVTESRLQTPQSRADAAVTAGQITDDLTGRLGGFDLMLNPTLARTSIPLSTVAGHVDDMDRYMRVNNEVFPYNYLFNVTGWPSLSIPAGHSSAGHPIGVQLSASLGSERLLLAVADSLLT